MGTRGALAKLTSIRRETDTSAPRLKRAPRVPVDLSEAERAIWHQLVPQIVRLGVVASVDAPLLRDLVRVLTRLEAAEADVSERGTLVADVRGQSIPNPSIGLASVYRKAALELSARFGLSPLDRERVRLTLATADRARATAERPRPPAPPVNMADDPRRILRSVG